MSSKEHVWSSCLEILYTCFDSKTLKFFLGVLSNLVDQMMLI